MIIQVILILGLLLCLLYAILQRQKSKLVSMTIVIVSVAAIYFVLFPEQTSRLAHFVGVGRGTDLVLYCWLVISLIFSVNLQFKILRLQGLLTELAREITLQAGRGGSTGAPITSEDTSI